MTNLHKLKLGAEKLEALQAAIDAIDEVTLAIENIAQNMDVFETINTNITTILQVPTKADEAIQSASDALASKNKAQKWAEEATDVEVEVGKYSAKHWAEKAEEAISTIDKASIGLGNVDNTSDANKPISIAQQTALDLKADEADVLPKSGGTMTGAITALRETKVAMGANDIDLALGNVFTKTISGSTTLTVSNVLASGNANSFILELTNGGAYAITWWSGITWAGGTVPTLTASGVDILGFYSHDGGTTWRAVILAKDSK